MSIVPLIHDLLADLHDRDVKLRVQGDQLACDAPAGVLTDDLVNRLREHKAEVLDVLMSGHCSHRANAQLQRAPRGERPIPGPPPPLKPPDSPDSGPVRASLAPLPSGVGHTSRGLCGLDADHLGEGVEVEMVATGIGDEHLPPQDDHQRGIGDLHRLAARQLEPKRDERVAAEHFLEGAGGHAHTLAARPSADNPATGPQPDGSYIAHNPDRQPVVNVLWPIEQRDPARARDLADAWQERIAIVEADADCRAHAERVALDELRPLIERRGHE